MFNNLLESSQRDDSIKWSNMGFGEEIAQVDLIEVNFTHLIWVSVNGKKERSNYNLMDNKGNSGKSGMKLK